jgi:hypothetical protein
MQTKRQYLTGSSWIIGRRSHRWVFGLLLGLLGGWQPGQAADFTCPGGDVACLITALNGANTNGGTNTITLAAGTYTLRDVDNTTDGPNGLPSITSTLTITGAGADTTTIERQASGSPTPPQFRLLHVAATGSLTLNGLTLRGGGGLGLFGGGIYNVGILTLTNSTLTANTAYSGGGIYNVGTATLTTCILTANTASRVGGGIENYGGTVTLTTCTLTANTAGGGGGGISSSYASGGSGTVTLSNSTLTANTAGTVGGGLFNSNYDGTVTLTNSTLAYNTAGPGGGGGIFNSGTATLTTCTLTANTANGPGGGGGGINNSGFLILTNCTLTDNTTNFLGGGINNFLGIATLSNSTLAYNTAKGGGGIDNYGTVTLTNSTLAYNTAGRGGAIENIGIATLSNSTLVYNTANGSTGGGIHSPPGAPTMEQNTTLQNTILALNTTPNASSPSDDCFGHLTSLGTNLLGDSSGCTITRPQGGSDLAGDPRLGRLHHRGRDPRARAFPPVADQPGN